MRVWIYESGFCCDWELFVSWISHIVLVLLSSWGQCILSDKKRDVAEYMCKILLKIWRKNHQSMNGEFNRRTTLKEMPFDDNTNRFMWYHGHNKQLVYEPEVVQCNWTAVCFTLSVFTFISFMFILIFGLRRFVLSLVGRRQSVQWLLVVYFACLFSSAISFHFANTFILVASHSFRQVSLCLT